MAKVTVGKTHNVELLVKAESLDRVKAVLAYVLDITAHKPTNVRQVDGLYMVQVAVDEEGLQDFYKKVGLSDEVAIIADPLSFRISQDVTAEIYIVETRLRHLLLHVSDLVEAFYDVVAEMSRWAKPQAQKGQIITKDKHEPLTSSLTLGETITILGFDLSHATQELTSQELERLLSESSNYAELRQNVQERNRKQLVWDIISKHVLDAPQEWLKVCGPLGVLKDYRDRAAHFKVFTQKDLEEVKKQAKHVLGLMKEKELTPKQQGALKAQSDVFISSLNSINKTTINPAILEYIAESSNIAASLMKGISPRLNSPRAIVGDLQTSRGLQGAIRNALYPGGIASIKIKSEDDKQ